MARKLFFTLFSLLVLNSVAQKTDVVYLFNGDRITGEVKALDFGKLKFKTDHASTIYLDWDDIITLQADKFLEISLTDGTRLFGSIDSCSDSGYVYIQELIGRKKHQLFTIVGITPIKKTFWSRIDGEIELGGSYTKASEVGQITGSFDAEYRGRNFLTGFRSSTIVTSQPEKEIAQKGDVNLYFTRMYNRNWFLTANANAERNTELGLEWRMLYGGAVGHDFVRKVYSRFWGGIGLYYNGEKGLDSTGVTSSIEPAFILSFKKLHYDSPEVDIFTQASIYPSLTESERVRVQYDLNTKFEIVKDFFLGINFYFSYDNKPRTENASKEDYGIVGSIGYSF